MDHLTHGLVALLLLGAMVRAAPVITSRTDIQVDGGRPLAGERSRFARSADGELVCLYTLVAGKHDYQPFLVVEPDLTARRHGLQTRTVWNMEGRGGAGWAFDAAYARPGDLRFAVKYHNRPFRMNYWYRERGAWRMETFGENEIFAGTSVSLLLKPDGSPVILCQAVEVDQILVWERSPGGAWTRSGPTELKGVRRSDFDAAINADGGLVVVFSGASGGPVAAVRGKDGTWRRSPAAEEGASGFVALAREEAGRLHLVYGAGPDRAQQRFLRYAVSPDGLAWSVRTAAEVPAGRHVSRTAIDVAASRVAIAWELGLGPQYVPKDYGATVGGLMLSLPDGRDAVTTTTLASEHAGRPGIALTADGKTALVSVYTGNANGDDFYILSCGLDGATPALRVAETDESALALEAARNEIGSRAPPATLVRGLNVARSLVPGPDANGALAPLGPEVLDVFKSRPEAPVRAAAIRFLGEHDLPAIREAVPLALEDPDPEVRAAVMPFLRSVGPLPAGIAQLRTSMHARAYSHRRDAARGIAALIANPASPGSAAFRALVADAFTDARPEIRILTARYAVEYEGLETLADAWRATLTPVVRELSADATGNDRQLRESAEKTLSALMAAPLVRGALLAALEDDDMYLRAQAADLLTRKRIAFDPKVLFPVFEGDGKAAQLTAIRAMNRARPEGAETVLRHAMQARPLPTRIAAVFALRSLCGMYPAPGRDDAAAARTAALEALEAGLADENPEVLYRVVQALGAHDRRSAADRILALTEHTDPRVRRSAEIASGQLGAAIAIKRGQRQLFIDDFLVEDMTGLTRSVRPPARHSDNPLITGTQPWERNKIYVYGTVLHDDDGYYKIWYRYNQGAGLGGASLIGYAVSKDGIKWDKPSLGVFPYKGSADNNITFPGATFIDNCTVFKDMQDPDPARRYKMLFWDWCADHKRIGFESQFFPPGRKEEFKSMVNLHRLSGLQLAWSPDGIHWTESADNPVQPGTFDHPWWREARQGSGIGDVANACWDPEMGVVRSYPKIMAPGRTVGYMESLDLAHWTDPEIVLTYATTGAGGDQYYGMTVTPYEGMYIGFLWIYHVGSTWTCDVQLTTSRDGVKWEHCSDRTPFLAAPGGRVAWDAGQVYTSDRFLVAGDEIRVYYGGAQGPHNSTWPPAAIGLATLKLDRFAAVLPTGKTGVLTTKPLLLGGRRVFVNVLSAQGALKVAVLDTDGYPVPGFETEQCRPVNGDTLSAPVTWKSDAAMDLLAGKPVKLAFSLEGDAELYSFHVK